MTTTELTPSRLFTLSQIEKYENIFARVYCFSNSKTIWFMITYNLRK